MTTKTVVIRIHNVRMFVTNGLLTPIQLYRPFVLYNIWGFVFPVDNLPEFSEIILIYYHT
jgi:hypothetical protein